MTENNYALIIDDEEIARDTLAALLDQSGYNLDFAADGQEGIRKAVELQPDVILLDVMMPVLDGFEVCREIRAHPQLAEVPIIMITALDDRTSRLTGLEAGADDFLTKPFDSLELKIRLRTLSRVNRYHHLRQERDNLAAAMETLAEKNKRLKQLSRQVVDAHESERRQLAVDLHDEIGQTLTGLKLTLQAGTPLQEDPRAIFTEALSIVSRLLQHVRELSLNLRPTILDDLGLGAALDWLFKRFARESRIIVHHNINALEEKRLPKELEVVLFRIAQEALTNVARHAHVDEVTVTLNREANNVQLTIMDHGVGFDTNAFEIGSSTGLSGMRERASLVGGNFRLQSALGEGTLLSVEFPLESTE